MSTENKSYQRFSLIQRIEHFVLILSFTILGLTGLAQKFALWPISQAFIDILGGIESTRIIHRAAAIVYFIEAVYHVIVLGYKLFVLRVEASFLPGIKDGKDALEALLYNLRLSKKQPKMPRYNFAEKAEYWAMMWGTVLMGLTGFMLWNPINVAKALPGQFIPAAKAAHGGEAVLAVLAIILWHFYNVHVKQFNKAMFTGKMSHHEMEEEHGDELEKIVTGKAVYTPPDAAAKRRRMTFFVPVAVVFLALSGYLLFTIVGGEETALAAYPPAVPTDQIFVRPTATPTSIPTVTPTAAPTSAMATPLSWDSEIGKIFTTKCGACHGASGGLGLKTYADLMAGGKSGAALLPGDAEGSLLVQLMKEGKHPGKFADDDLAKVIEWINAGALEK